MFRVAVWCTYQGKDGQSGKVRKDVDSEFAIVLKKKPSEWVGGKFSTSNCMFYNEETHGAFH